LHEHGLHLPRVRLSGRSERILGTSKQQQPHVAADNPCGALRNRRRKPRATR
jgi:hypothetical protein